MGCVGGCHGHGVYRLIGEPGPGYGESVLLRVLIENMIRFLESQDGVTKIEVHGDAFVVRHTLEPDRAILIKGEFCQFVRLVYEDPETQVPAS